MNTTIGKSVCHNTMFQVIGKNKIGAFDWGKPFTINVPEGSQPMGFYVTQLGLYVRFLYNRKSRLKEDQTFVMFRTGQNINVHTYKGFEYVGSVEDHHLFWRA